MLLLASSEIHLSVGDALALICAVVVTKGIHRGGGEWEQFGGCPGESHINHFATPAATCKQSHIVTGLDDRGSRVRFPTGAGNFSLHHSVQTGSGAHAASYPMGTRGSFPRDKAAGT
jgi:hypothetical protein